MTYRYAETKRAYQRRTHQNKTITIRCGKEGGVAISSRMQAAYNLSTNHINISCALWHTRAIYPSVRAEQSA